jgi:hypothetical protein
MFFCNECHRPARVLYAPNTGQQHRPWLFSCRKCAGITYQSTMGHRWDRSARRMEKLRARRAQVTLESTGLISTLLICGDNAETGLRALGDGRFAEFVRWRVGVGRAACALADSQHHG